MQTRIAKATVMVSMIMRTRRSWLNQMGSIRDDDVLNSAREEVSWGCMEE